MINPDRVKNLLKKKKHYRFLYKKLIDLKMNVQDRTKIINFKRKKWKQFIEFLQKDFNSKKQGFKFYDQSSDNIFKFQTRFKQNYKKKLQAQKRFNYYYGCFSRKYLKIQIKAAKNKRKSFGEKSWILSKIFISLFERRLDTVLYRSQFVLTIKQARQLISHKHIKINGKVVNISSYLVQKGDLIDLIPKKKAAITLNEIKNPIWPVPEKHLQVNYRTYQIIFVGNLEANSFETSFFFHLELKNVLNYYK